MSMICALREVDEKVISHLLQNPEQITSFLNDEIGEFDLDKAWHAIHFLLTGSAWEGEEPLCFLVKGGQQIGSIDLGFGPARALRPDQVKRFDEALSSVSAEQLRAMYDAQRMQKEGIYPDIWDREDEEDETKDYVIEYFEMLKTFVDQTSKEGKGVIIYLS
jgi:hypothetical protein